jgi:hypothetical protein
VVCNDNSSPAGAVSDKAIAGKAGLVSGLTANWRRGLLLGWDEVMENANDKDDIDD